MSGDMKGLLGVIGAERRRCSGSLVAAECRRVPGALFEKPSQKIRETLGKPKTRISYKRASLIALQKPSDGFIGARSALG